jgi:hypothetical protein
LAVTAAAQTEPLKGRQLSLLAAQLMPSLHRKDKK